ncbi:chromosome segregation protein SMC [Corallococcus praedator]|uniref:Chromosome segregation protein SMC n=1 Tax=Corallococcus praedator TaxID=2316724 RepID=A0ABX9QFG8_9BACT|nr:MULTISPECIES: ATP-binding protein [Corallococcus]RKH26109.1 chromosome segregation protein SMC [Corallococcus sp. CA031C]RKI05752.1 chromosome segregation protein SMC [Corallococcus praedator]
MRKRQAVSKEKKVGPGDHIARITVERFKSLEKVTVDFGSVNVFIGANGAGKSNLLEAIGLIGAAASGRVDDQALLRRGVRPGVPRLYRSSFPGKHHGGISIEVEAQSKAAYKSSISNRSNPPKPYWSFSHETLRDEKKSVASRGPNGARLVGKSLRLETHGSVAAVARANQATPKAVRDFLQTLDDYAIFAPVTPVLRGIAPDSAPRSPVGLYGGQLPEALSTLLGVGGKKKFYKIKQAALQFIDWAKDFRVAEPSRAFISPSVPTMREVVSFNDRYMRDGGDTLSGYDASEGALYILFALVLAMHPQSPRCFALDNFDQALNPAAARDLAKSFTEFVLLSERQAFLTTHNPLVLDGLPLDDSRVRLFSVQRDQKGHTKISRIEVQDIFSLKKKHGDDAISRLWVGGRLGGMPRVRPI